MRSGRGHLPADVYDHLAHSRKAQLPLLLLVRRTPTLQRLVNALPMTMISGEMAARPDAEHRDRPHHGDRDGERVQLHDDGCRHAAKTLAVMADAVASSLTEMSRVPVISVGASDHLSLEEIRQQEGTMVIAFDVDVAVCVPAVLEAVFPRIERHWQNMPPLPNPTLTVLAAVCCRGFGFSHATIVWPGFVARTFMSIWRIAEMICLSCRLAAFSTAMGNRSGITYARYVGIAETDVDDRKGPSFVVDPLMMELEGDAIVLTSSDAPREFSSMAALLARCRRSR